MNEKDQTIEVLDENKQIALRREKLTALRQIGNAFPNHFHREDLAKALQEKYQDCSTEQLAEAKHPVSLAGRIMTRRMMGKASFVTIQDMSGKIQLYIREEELIADQYEAFKNWDLGDIIGVEGFVFKTKVGELSVHVQKIILLTKALRPLPDKFHGLADQELRYRQRYVDLIANEETRRTFLIRSQTINTIRQYLLAKNYVEAETPMMHVIPGGAAAKPFKTHHQALDMELYLRIAPELYLKRLVVGGLERVFEINRNFRNEGLSTRHNPEFTMLEFYQAYSTYHDLMDLTEDLLRHIALTVLGTTQIHYQGDDYDLSKPFKRVSMKQSIVDYAKDISLTDLDDMSRAKKIAAKLHIKVETNWGLGKIQTAIFEEVVEPHLKQPTFITEHPAEVSPLARCNDDNPFITDRCELYIGGREIANMFSELNDSEDQAERFRQQVAAKEAGDDEAMHYDEDYIRALEYGLPPTAGEGIGIDRLVMFLTNSPTIRDVLLFPHMRPEKNE